MKIKFYIVILFLIFFTPTYGQKTNNESLAREYYRQGEFKKAEQLFKEVYKKKKVRSIYDKYIVCLIKNQSYKEAEKVIKGFYKKTKNPTILIDLGKLYVVKEEAELANKTFNQALKEAEKNERFLPAIGGKFFKEKKYTLALSAYSAAKKSNNKAGYSIQIANIYSYLGDMESMYKEVINLLIDHPSYLQSAKNIIRRTIDENDQNENNKILKKLLIKSVQKDNSYEVSKTLIWLFMQEKKFEDALQYEISIDKRILSNKNDIINLSEIALSNKEYAVAIKALEYVINNIDTNTYYYEYCQLNLLDVKFFILEENKIKKKSDIIQLKEQYTKIINAFDINSETIPAIKNYCYLMSNYLEQEEEAIKILEHTIQNTNLEPIDIAICKIELAKILTSKNDVWEAVLIYSQVEKDFKNDVIGQEAKFQKTKINYYKGDFEWAQNQLNVLKLSTSKLIANNAMQLSLLISDNLNLDTTNTALLLYAKSELLCEQKKYSESLQKLNELEAQFPDHTLADEILLKKFNIYTKQKDYIKALDALSVICDKYYYDILYDDALFYQAQIYDIINNDKIKAKEKYEELLLKCPNSIFINQARKRYKELRANNFLKL